MSKMFSDLYERQSEEDKRTRQEEAKEPETEKARNLGTQEPGQEVGNEGAKEQGKKAGVEPAKASSSPPVAEDRPTYKTSYLFTQEEFEMSEDLKRSLRREYGIQAYKNDLARAAIRLLAEDFRAKGEKSYLVERFYRKRK